MTGINEIVKSLSDVINICDRYGMFGIADELFSIIREISPDWETEQTEREESCMEIKSGFFTVIVIEVGIFGSEIANEKHFQTEEKAREFCQTVKEGQIAVVAKVS